jgi:4-amino-4-deoxy-L-arabinose transferase-like glycosyltransferase
MTAIKKWLDWAFCLWLVAITIRYAMTTWKTLHNPFTPGDDAKWFMGWTAACAIAFLLSRVLRPARLWQGVCVVGAIAAVGVFTLGHVWIGALVAVWLLAACLAVGVAMARRLGIATEDVAELIALGIPLGMAPLSLVLLGLGLAGLFSWIPIAVLFGIAVLLFVKERPSLRTAGGIPFDSMLPVTLISLSALLNLFWAVAPEVQFDALNYHLAVPEAYLRAGAIVDLRFLHAYLSKAMELLFAAGLALGGAPAVKLFVYGLGLFAAVATYALGKALFNPRVGMWAAAIFYTAPAVGWLTGTVYIDNLIALLCTAVLLVFVKWFHSRDTRWFVVASILAGLAVGAKLNAAFAFVIVLPLMTFQCRREWKRIGVGAGAFVLVALPTYLLAWKYTGNPIFPLLNGFFKSPVWPDDNAIFNAADFGLPRTLPNLGVFPFRLALDTARFGEAVPRGAVGISLLIAAFALLFLPRLGRAAGILFAAAAAYLVILFFTMQYARYFVAILPVVAVLAAATCFAITAEKTGWKLWLVEACLFVGIVAQFPAFSTQYDMLPQRFPVRVALGLEDRETFARRALPGYEAAQHINASIRPGERILGVDVEQLRFYLQAPLTTLSLSLLDDPVRELSSMQPDARLVDAIRKQGFTHLFVRSTQLRHPAPWFPYLNKDFLEKYATLEFSDDGASVYRF